jgi:hypothetical protein
LVEHHFESLGFEFLGNGDDGATRWSLDLGRFMPFDVAISTGDDY